MGLKMSAIFYMKRKNSDRMAVLARFYDINIRNLALKKYIQHIDLRAKASQFIREIRAAFFNQKDSGGINFPPQNLHALVGQNAPDALIRLPSKNDRSSNALP